MNPLKGFMGAPQSPVDGIMRMFPQGMNPAQAVANQMLQSDPEARSFIQGMQNQSNGRTAKEMALQFGKQNGISEKDIMRLGSFFGLK